MLISSWGRLNLEEQELVAVTGRTFVLYRRNEEEPKIVLPKAKQKG